MSAPVTGRGGIGPANRPRRPAGRPPGLVSILVAAGLAFVLILTLFLAMGRLPGAVPRYPPESPSGPDRLTGRMRDVRSAIEARFDLPYGSGCYRVDDGAAGGEHPLGRACDFMIGPAGRMPTPEQARLGEEIAAWAQQNAREYGIWYVIYRQEIWSTRWPLQGWRSMEDRGGVTLNHFDHVHISVW